MIRFLARIVFGALGLALAAYLLPGVSYSGIVDLLIAALLLGIVNAILGRSCSCSPCRSRSSRSACGCWC